VNLLGGGYTSTVRRTSRSVEIVFPARRQKSTSQSIEPPAIDGKALQCGSFLTLYSDESKAQCPFNPKEQCLSFQPEGAMPVLSTSKEQCLSFQPFYLFDGLGSTTQLASSTGPVTDSYLYDSFGDILLASGTTPNWFRYGGRLGYYFDSDLTRYQLRRRAYDPLLGRFLTRDPIRNFASYVYVLSNPVTLTDPSGLYAVCCTFQTRPWFGQPETWSETVDCSLGTPVTACCTNRAGGYLYSWAFVGKSLGPCGVPAAPNPNIGLVICIRGYCSNFFWCSSSCSGFSDGLYTIDNAPCIELCVFTCAQFGAGMGGGGRPPMMA
jgi:RHS repeat-associated protein